jgi:hypothetical protein
MGHHFRVLAKDSERAGRTFALAVIGFSEDEIAARVSDQSKSATFWNRKRILCRTSCTLSVSVMSASLPMVIGNSFIWGLNP